jgi:hypothetical protein
LFLFNFPFLKLGETHRNKQLDKVISDLLNENMLLNIGVVASLKCGFREATYLWYAKASWMGPKGEFGGRVPKSPAGRPQE